MISVRQDWLDALARYTVEGANPSAPARTDVTTSGNRFSRTAALKLGLAGAASLSVGLWKTPPASAQTREGCFTGCFTEYEKELKRRLQSCKDVFKPYEKNPDEKWSGFAVSMFGPNSQITLARQALTGICYADAKHDVRGDKDDCYKGCEEKCGSRRPQSNSSFAGVLEPACEVTPPHKAPPPQIPTPPNPDNDVCSICAGQNNVCCPGGSPEAGGLCACAPPDTPCEIYAGSCA